VENPDVTSATRPADVLVQLLREAGAPLDAAQAQQRLMARGMPAGEARALWRRAQRAVRRRPDVTFDPARGTYRLNPPGFGGPAGGVPPLSGEEALERLLPRRMSGRQAELAGLVRSALKERDDLEARLRAGYVAGRDLRAAQERQIRIESVRALADVVAEVEELAAAGVAADITLERVRALARASGLDAIGRVGEMTAFAPAWHAPIGSRPSDDSRVTVIRPGYTWRTGAEVVLIHKAQVAWSQT
jgi:hypothetical protein